MSAQASPYPVSATCCVCAGIIAYSGRGRVPTTCSAECRRAVRADDARARRNPPPALERVAPPTHADVSRIRASLRASATERHARYADRAAGLARHSATHSDIQLPNDEAPATLGGLGYSGVSPARGGGTTWASDFSQASQSRRARRDAEVIREACIAEAIREARGHARARGMFDPFDVDLADAYRRGNERADGILGALAAA